MPRLFPTLGGARKAQLAHALRSVPLFREIPAADLVAVWDRLTELRVPAGTVLFRQGDPGDRFYAIKEGALEVRLGTRRTGMVVRRRLPGDFVGELALLTGQPRSADVVVVEDAVLWALDRAHFETLLTRSAPLLLALNRALADRVAVVTRQLEDLAGSVGDDLGGLRFGPYRVTAQLGVGGMAAVYSAAHEDTETAVAVKVLPAAWGAAPELRERLTREAAILQGIAHPHVIKLLEIGEVEARLGGGCYLVMEWLPHALDRVLRARFPEPLPLATALLLARRVADGLAAVHAAGIVHRDVKPSNILLRSDGTPVLTDFGLATALVETGQQQRLTAENVIVGTADYLSPEQVAGLPVDGRADVYSLGVVLYEMLAGHVPFAGREPMQTLQAHVEESPPPLPNTVLVAARAIVERALQKRPADRFTSAAAMAGALETALR